jgi:hypothetical protein
LYGPNVVAILKEVRRKRMTERMATGRLGDPGLASGFFDGLLGGEKGVRNLFVDGDAVR